jgi:hypothetical protein
MLASFPASMLNQKLSDLGILNRFKLDPSRSSVPDSEVRSISRSHVSNFGIERDTSKPIELAWLSFSPHDELAAQPMRTSEPPRQGRIFRPRSPCLAGLPQLELAPNPKGTDLP